MSGGVHIPESPKDERLLEIATSPTDRELARQWLRSHRPGGTSRCWRRGHDDLGTYVTLRETLGNEEGVRQWEVGGEPGR